jgi:hypothetical protein
MVNVEWLKFSQPGIVTYKVFSTFAGFSGKLVNLSGKTLIISLDGGDPQTITFGGDIIRSFHEQVEGGRAYVDFSGNAFTFRSNNKAKDATLSIIGGTAVPFLDIEGDFVLEPKELGEISAITNSCNLSFVDHDGSYMDHYIVVAMDENGVAVDQSEPFRALNSEASICVLEGILFDITGMPAVDAEIKILPAIYDQRPTEIGKLTNSLKSFMTRPNGFFSIPLVKCATVHVNIPLVGYSGYINVPDQDFVFLNELLQTEDSKYLNYIIL